MVSKNLAYINANDEDPGQDGGAAEVRGGRVGQRIAEGRRSCKLHHIRYPQAERCPECVKKADPVQLPAQTAAAVDPDPFAWVDVVDPEDGGGGAGAAQGGVNGAQASNGRKTAQDADNGASGASNGAAGAEADAEGLPDDPEPPAAGGVDPPPGIADPILGAAGSQAAYPVERLPYEIQPLVSAVSQLSSVPASMAAQAVLASITLAVSPNISIMEGPRAVSPTLVFVTGAESGQRKSRANAWAMFGHEESDKAVGVKWRAAVKQHKKAIAECMKIKEDGGTPNWPKVEPVKRAPVSLQSDISAESLKQHLHLARARAGLFNDEGASLLSGWNSGRAVRQRLLSSLVLIDDAGMVAQQRIGDGGEDVVYHDYGRALTQHLMMQNRHLLELLTSPQAGDGFTPRALASYNTHQHYMPEPEGEVGKSVMAAFSGKMKAWRAAADEELIYQADGGGLVLPERAEVVFDGGAQAALEDHLRGVYQGAGAGVLADGGLRAAFRARKHGTVKRLAAVFAGWRFAAAHDRLPKSGDQVGVNAEEVESAAAVVGWHESELGRVELDGGSAFTGAVNKVIGYMTRRAERLAQDEKPGGSAKSPWEGVDGRGWYWIMPSQLKQIKGDFAADTEFRAKVMRYLYDGHHLLRDADLRRAYLNPQHWQAAAAADPDDGGAQQPEEVDGDGGV